MLTAACGSSTHSSTPSTTTQSTKTAATTSPSASSVSSANSTPPTASAGAQSGSAAPENAAAQAFLGRYVTSDGRVLRHDQGGDIVSEGQAYAMLIAELAGVPSKVRTIWSWTKSHLQRPDALLSWHARSDGSVIDKQSAADGDTLVAYALLRYDGPDAQSLHDDGRRLASAVLAHETTKLGDGRLVVVAGPWATGSGVVDPSYWMPAVDDDLASLTGDDRWSAVAKTAVQLVSDVTDGGRRLPPDWAKVQGNRIVATGTPDGSTGVQYGLDAQRLPLWFATACSGQAQELAAGWWKNALSQNGRASAIALSTDGKPLNTATNPLSLLAGAAAASAAKDSASSNQLRGRAEAQAKSTPTYYGDAWLALGPALLDGQLTHCS
ncbi:MAG: glycosyl hydrolase family 8 [Acidothermaceae bacterium]